MGVGLLLCVVIWNLVGVMNASKNGQTITKHAEVIRWPVGTSFTFLGIVIPLVCGLLAYLYSKYPAQSYSFLLSSLAIFLVVALIALFLGFSLLRFTDQSDQIRLAWPADRYIVCLQGIMLSLLFLGLLYFCAFFLFQFSPANNSTIPIAAVKSLVTLNKPQLSIGYTKQEVVAVWGQPTHGTTNGDFVFDGPESTVTLTFDSQGVLSKFTIEKKDK